MNLILFAPSEIARPLPRADARAIHLLQVLRRREGDRFDAGLVNGPRGKGTLVKIAPDYLVLEFSWGEPPPPPDALTLVIGLPRPQTARKILQEASALGVQALHFVTTGKGEASYARSTLWTTGEWRQHVRAGVAQAFCTRLPEVTHGRSLAATLAVLPVGGTRLALDNYEAPTALSPHPAPRDAAVIVAFGAERGWSGAERDQLRAAGFIFVHLGPRVLRLETAVVAAVAVLKAQRGAM